MMATAAPARFNPLPRFQEVRPLEAINADDNTEASKRAIQRKWDEMESQRRAAILHYFNTIPGKFSLSEAQITTHSQAEYAALPNDVKEAVLKAVVGWHWDYELRDPLPAAQIAFGLGGYTLSQAAELAIQTFSLMPAPFREKLVKTYAIWDDLKTRGENAVSGMTVQTAISGAARAARRNYAAWRRAWNELTAEQKTYFFLEYHLYPSVTRVHHNDLAGRDFDHLPADVQSYLYDHLQVNEIQAKVVAGMKIYYERRSIAAITGARVGRDWPRDRIPDFIITYQREWNGSTTAERTELLRFLRANDPYLFERSPDLGNYPPYLENDIENLSTRTTYQLAEATSGKLLGHLAMYYAWWKYRSPDSLANLKFTLTGILVGTAGTMGRDAATLDTIDGVATRLAEVLTGEPGRSYNLWISNQPFNDWILKLAYYREQHNIMTETGRQAYNNIRQADEVRRRARFQAGQAVKVNGVLNYCKVVGISPASTQTVKYNIVVHHAVEGDDIRPPAYTIGDVEETRLEAWSPWPFSRIVAGLPWDEVTMMENRYYWLRAVHDLRISSDHPSLTGDIAALASRTWRGLGADIQRKLIYLFAVRGIIDGIQWLNFHEHWARLNIGQRAGYIFNAMATIVTGEEKALQPSNEPRMQGAVQANNFYDLPLDYIYGLAISTIAPAYINRAEEWALIYEFLSPKYNQASEDDAIYFAIGAGIDPQVAVSTVRPLRFQFDLLAEYKAYTMASGFKAEAEEHRRTAGVGRERWSEVFTSLVQKGRARVPELPRAPASDELNAAWGGSNYQNRYMVVIGAIGRDIVLQAYAEHDYQPPPNYIQAASATNLFNIRDGPISQTLVREYETVERSFDALRRRGQETLTFIANSLNQAAAQGRNEAEGRAQRVWDALNAHVRDFVMIYVRTEIDDTIQTLAEWPLWANLHARAKTALTNLPDWELAKKNGAAKALERVWPIVTPEARRSWLLGVGVPINEGHFQAIMSRSWLEYQQVPALFTSEIINVMVNGIEGNYGDDALSIIRIKGESWDGTRLVPSTGIPFGQVDVGDFLRVRSANRVHYGFAVFLNRLAPTPFGDARIPDRIYGNWNTSYFAAYDEAFRLTTENIRAEFQEQRSEGMLSSAPESDITEIVRFEADHPLPILADDVWGRDDDIQRAIAIRAPLLAGILLKAPIAVADRLLAYLYPGRGDIFSNFHQNSGWGAFPAEMRSWLIRAIVLPNLYSLDRAEIELLYRSQSGSNLSICRQWLRALGGPNLEALMGSDATWDPILFPLMVYAIRKGILGVEPPTGTTPLALPTTPPLTPAPATPAPPAVAPAPTPAPAAPARVTIAQMREAWDASEPARRASVLLQVHYSPATARRLSSQLWRDLPSATRVRLRRGHGQSVWRIRDGTVVTVAERVPPTPAPEPETRPTAWSLAWDALTPRQRIGVLRRAVVGVEITEASARSLSRLRFARLHNTIKAALLAGWNASIWDRDGAVPEPPSVAPTPAPPAIPRVGSITHLRIGDLVQSGLSGPLVRYGVIAHIGPSQEFGGPENGVWAIWKDTRERAKRAYTGASLNDLRPIPSGGRLAFRVVQGPSDRVSLLERGIEGPREWLAAAPPPPAPPAPTAPATPAEAWDRLTPAGRIPLITHFSLPSGARNRNWADIRDVFRLRLTEAWNLREWGLEPSGAVWIHAPLTEAVPLTPAQRATLERVEATGAVVTDIRPTRGGAVRVTATPPPKPPVVAPPVRRAAPEDFFEDPFRRAIEETMPQNTWNWNRAQLVVTQAELESYASHITVNFFYAREGGHGVPVPYILAPLTNANIQESETRRRELRDFRWWQRLKNAVRHRQGQALVSLQVGEFYKHGKWWRHNTVQANVGKHRHVPTTKYDRRQLEAGIKVEMEHTDDAAEALEIAKDHLDEIPDYYTRLLKMEKKALKKQEKKALKAFRHERHKMLGPVAFDFKMDENPAPASFHMAQFRSDVYPIKVIDEFLQRHAEGWVTSFGHHYNIDRLPVTKRVYIAISTDPADKHKPLVDKIIAVVGLTQNRWDNIDDVFIAVHTEYRRLGVARQITSQLYDLCRKWINPETGRGARRIYLLVKDANTPSNRLFENAGFERIEQFLNTAGELVNRYMKELYEPPRENP